MFSGQPANPQPQPLGEEPIQPEIPQNSKFSFIKNIKLWQITLLLILLIPTSAYFLSKNQTTKQILTASASPTPTLAANVSILTPLEKSQIDTWIQENKLNTYGDPADTAYPGGTPLFNEATGKTTDKYDYIAEKHTDRPWCTPRPACLDATPRCLIPETAQMCPKRDTKTSCTTDSQCPKDYFCEAITQELGQGTICPDNSTNCTPTITKPAKILSGECKPNPIQCKSNTDCTNGGTCMITCPMIACIQGQPCPTCSGIGICSPPLPSTKPIKGIIDPATYSCPTRGVDCIPTTDSPRSVYCEPNYRSWIETNCKGIGFTD